MVMELSMLMNFVGIYLLQENMFVSLWDETDYVILS